MNKIGQKYGFRVLNWLLTIIAATQAIFGETNFWKMCKNCVHCKIYDNLLPDSGLRLKPHQWVTPSTQENKFWFYLYLLWSYRSSKVKRVNFLRSISLRHLTLRKKCDGFLPPGTKSCPTVHNMNEFAARISSHYYSSIDKIQNCCW